MKQLQLLLALCLAVFSLSMPSCGDDEPLAPSFSTTEVTMSPLGTAADAELIGKIKVKNETASEITLKWVRQNVNVPTGWETAVCDHVQCYDKAMGERPLVIAANSEIELKLNFYPNGTAGTGTGELKLYDPANQTGTEKVFSFSATARQ
jgi:hypothetical protein